MTAAQHVGLADKLIETARALGLRAEAGIPGAEIVTLQVGKFPRVGADDELGHVRIGKIAADELELLRRIVPPLRDMRRDLTFGEVALDAGNLDVPKDVKLKDPKTFKIIGRKTDRIDNADIVTGKAEYGIDVRVPGMLYAVVKRCPAFGGKVISFDDTKAKAIPVSPWRSASASIA